MPKHGTRRTRKDQTMRNQAHAFVQTRYSLGDAEDRIIGLEVALRAALSFVQERHTDPGDGHAVMVVAALRGALRKDRD